MDYRQALPLGTVLDGKYRIDRVIGSGGFGITYEAFDLRLGSPVAIKEYFPSQFGLRDTTYSVRPRSDDDRDIFERLRASFLREARTLNQFDHPAIVRVLNVFEAYGTAYMVMKYETGSSVKRWLADLGRLPTQEQLDRLTMPLLDALEAMHKAAFLHRDVAPDNIVVRGDGNPVLLDFGASRRVMGEMTGTLTGVVKKGYSPQEQYATDGRSQGPWTDIYALGATLYRCISGETPYEATERMLEDHVLPAISAGAGHFRHEFLAAIDAAMVLRPKERPQSIAEWREMLFDGAVPSGQPRSCPTAERPPAAADASPGGRTPPQGTTLPGGNAFAPRIGPTHPVAAEFDLPLAVAALPASPRRSKTAIVLAAAVVVLIGGGALLLASNYPGLVRATSVQPQVGSGTPKPVAPLSPQDSEIQRLSREATERATEETRRRLDEEVRQRAADEARFREAEELRKRQLAAEIEARRKAEDAHRQAVEDASKRAAENARLRKLAEEAQRRQGEQLARLKQEVLERAAEAERRRSEEKTRQLSIVDELRRREGEREDAVCSDEAERLQALVARGAAARQELAALSESAQCPRIKEASRSFLAAPAVTEDERPSSPKAIAVPRKHPVIRKGESRPAQRSAGNERRQINLPVAKKKCEPFYADVRRTTDLCR